MLYRFFDCAIFDNDVEPYTTLWIEGSSANDAYERAQTFLSFAWRIPADKVCVNGMGTVEWEILDNSAQSKEAGDRRLWESGSTGERPHYSAQRVMIIAVAKERERLMKAWREAQKHATELARELDDQARVARDLGQVREAENHEFDAKKYRDFVAADLI
jgi:hypothetical protein